MIKVLHNEVTRKVKKKNEIFVRLVQQLLMPYVTENCVGVGLESGDFFTPFCHDFQLCTAFTIVALTKQET